MVDGELSEQISDLETEIEELAEKLARCRKLELFSKVAILSGGLLLLVLMLGLVRFDPTAMVGAIAAVLGGIVLFGSNTRTTKDYAAAMKAAEDRRMELIGRIDLRVVHDRANAK
jgi:hypothetical protein